MVNLNQLDINFLGTGGGRFVMITQMRRTGGIRVANGGANVHIDPGPGALVFSNWAGLRPQSLDAIVVSHCHPDHYSDAEVFIEAMSHGTVKKRGVLAAPRSVLYGNGGLGPSISPYHQSLVEKIEVLKPSSSFDVRGLKFEAVETRHSDPDTVGLKFKSEGLGSVGYTSDTGYFPELGDLYSGIRLLVICTMRPRGKPLPLHLSVDEALKLIDDAKPQCVALTHFGMLMLKAGPDSEAEFLESNTGVPTIAARDGMKITLDKKITVSGPRKKDEARVIHS